MEAAGRVRLTIEAKLSPGPPILNLRRHGDNSRWHELRVFVSSGNFLSAKYEIVEAADTGSGETDRFRKLQVFMGFVQRIKFHLCEEISCSLMHRRCYSSKIDWKKLRPMILERINKRAGCYPLKSMIPVANDVLKARGVLVEGVSALLNVIPVKACKCCPEVYIGKVGHKIKTCYGFKRIIKDREHRWVNGTLNDILVPVETFHLQTMFLSTIKHEQRFDFDRVPAVIELCSQAGADIPETLYNQHSVPNGIQDLNGQLEPDAQLQIAGQRLHGYDDGYDEQVALIGQRTLEAWERVRLGVQKLLLVYTAKVCEHCSEVHIGPSGHKARLCGVFKYEGWRGSHWWKKAGVDDLVHPKVVWHRRPQDPPVLKDSGRGFYGHAPAVVELCMQAGARVPKKYFTMMKVQGLAPTAGHCQEANRVT